MRVSETSPFRRRPADPICVGPCVTVWKRGRGWPARGHPTSARTRSTLATKKRGWGKDTQTKSLSDEGPASRTKASRPSDFAPSIWRRLKPTHTFSEIGTCPVMTTTVDSGFRTGRADNRFALSTLIWGSSSVPPGPTKGIPRKGYGPLNRCLPLFRRTARSPTPCLVLSGNERVMQDAR